MTENVAVLFDYQNVHLAGRGFLVAGASRTAAYRTRFALRTLLPAAATGLARRPQSRSTAAVPTQTISLFPQRQTMPRHHSGAAISGFR